MASPRSAPMPSDRGRSLRHVRAAQLRTRATRQAIIQMLLGTVFLIGALSYARAPDRHAQAEANQSPQAQRGVQRRQHQQAGHPGQVRLRRRLGWVWMAATGAWALLSL